MNFSNIIITFNAIFYINFLHVTKLLQIFTFKVTIVNAGTGLTIESGTAQANPTIGVDYTGINNFIRLGENPEVATADDFMLFEDVSTGDVKSTTLGTIPTSALTLVQDTINTTVSNPFVVKNNTDIYPSIPTVFQVITLTQAEYDAIVTKDGNTLYLIGTGITQFTKTLAISNSIVGTQYTLGGDQVGATRTGAEGSAYSFATTVTPNSGYEFTSGPTINDAFGNFDSTGPVTTTISGTVAAIDPGTCTANLFDSQGNTTIVNGLTINDGAVENVNYEITSTTNTISGTCGTAFTSSNFGVAVSLVALQDPNQWEIIGPDNTNPIAVGNGITYSPASGTLNGSTPVTCTVTGTVREKPYILQYNIDNQDGSGVYGQDYTILNSNPSGTSFNGGTAPLTQTISGKFSDTYNIVTTYSNVAGSNNDTVISSVSEGTFSGKIISGITGTLGDSAPANVILTQTIVSETDPIAAAPSFQFSTFAKNIECVQTSATPTDCSTNPVGYTYAGMTYTVTPPGGVPSAAIPINLGTTVTQYNNIDFESGTVITLSLADPGLDPGFQAISGGITTTYSGTNVNLNGQFTLTAGEPTNQVGVTQTGQITNRLNQLTVSPTGAASASAACGLNTQTGVWLQKAGTNTAQFAENGDVVWLTQLGSTQLSPNFYRALVGAGGVAADGQPGTIQLSASGVVSNAAVCPVQNSVTAFEDNNYPLPRNAYSVSLSYSINGGTPITGSVATSNVGDSVVYTATVTGPNPGYYITSPLGVTYTPSNTIVIPPVGSPSNSITYLITGSVAALQPVVTSAKANTAGDTCPLAANTSTWYKTGAAGIINVGDTIYIFNDITLGGIPAGFYKQSESVSGESSIVQVGSGGVVSAITTIQCGLIEAQSTGPIADPLLDPCTQDTEAQFNWKTGSSVQPFNGEILYSNSLGTDFADPGEYRLQLAPGKKFTVGANGVISGVQSCP